LGLFRQSYFTRFSIANNLFFSNPILIKGTTIQNTLHNREIQYTRLYISNFQHSNFEALEQTYALTVKKLEKNSNVLFSVVEKSIRKTEQEQRDIGDKNLIIFGLAETDAKQETLEIVQKLIHDCHLHNKIEQQYVHKLGRVDNIKVDKQGRNIPRPLKLCTKTRAEKWKIIKRINQLRVQGIFAKPDLTKEEKEADFWLKMELKKTREEDPILTK